MRATSRCCRTPIDTNNTNLSPLAAAAVWLVARPQNAVLALGLLLVLSGPAPTGSVVLVLLTLAQGTRLALLQAGSAVAVVTLVSLLVGSPMAPIVLTVAGVWVPSILLASLLLATRSLTLVMQVSAILMIAGLTGFMVVVSDPAAFWEPVLVWIDTQVQGGTAQHRDVFTPENLLLMMAAAFWLFAIAALCLGNAWYAKLPERSAQFGRFRDLNFGRVIAAATLVFTVVAQLSGWSWAWIVGSFLFSVFAVQGVSLAHWLKAAGMLPAIVVIAAYVLTLVPYVAGIDWICRRLDRIQESLG